MSPLISIPLMLAMVGCVLLIPLGLPGLWVIGIVGVALFFGGR